MTPRAALFVAMDVMRLIGFRSFSVGAILLCGLLAYDVFWVFGSPSVVGSNVMMEVATQSGPVGPSRLLFPIAAKAASSRFPFSLLGLGDVVVPALYTNLMLRWDRHRLAGEAKEGGGQNLYLYLALASYAVGLGAASYANQVTSAGQPALLYIVPSMLLVTSTAAVARGEFGDLLAFETRAAGEED